MKFIFKQNKKYVTGFTLVETLVALSIFSISILGLMSVLAKGISDTGYAKQKDTATYLAQEGVELMRNMRDTYVLYDAGGASVGWNNFNNKIAGGVAGTSFCAQSNGYGCWISDLTSAHYSNQNMPITTLSVTACGSDCPTILYYPSTGKYGYSGSGPVNTGLVRRITVVPGANETRVTSRVSWTQGSGSYNVTFSETLFNWVE